MQPSLACPQRGDYERLIHGELAPSEVERLSQHLAGCSVCADAVQPLLDDDTLLSVLHGTTADAPNGEKVPAGLTQRLLALAAPVPGEQSGDSVSHLISLLAPPQTPDEIGRLAHYRVLKVLGSGGMGVVFLAEDTLLGRTAALKTMKPDLAADPRHRQRFLREARTAAKIENDHIVPIYGVGEDRGVPWLAMPLLKGQSLDELLKQVRVLKPAEAVRLGAQVAKGLAGAHAAGLIHRDVKPANIWVGPEDRGRAKLLDFGLARDNNLDREGEKHLTRTGAVVGTPAFMAPEQANSEPLDARADLFSLGCVLYRMVTGRLPFQGRGWMDTLRALATETPPDPHEVNPAVPRSLSALIMSLLSKDRSDRPASASAVAAALEAMQEKPISSAQQTRSVAEQQQDDDPRADRRETTELRAPIAAPRRRWRRTTAAALLLALGGALAAGIVVIIKNREGKEVARVTVPDGASAEIKLDGDSGKATVDRIGSKPDRRAAEWVLSIGGTIKVRQGLQERDTQVAKDLPADSFEMVSVNLHGNQKVDDAGLEHLRGLTNLKELSLGGTRISNTGLEQLKGLTSLSSLSLGGTGVSDAGLVHLRGLSNLTALWLGHTQVKDAGLVRLKKLLNLTLLDLTGTQVSDDGLVHLKGLINLTSLALSDTQVGNDGLEHLKGLTRLTALWLNGTKVNDDGLVHLKGLTQLTGLVLNGTRVSGDGLVHLKGLTNLTSLGLSCERVRDAGLEHLVGLTNLTELWLDGTRVSSAGLVHLKGLTQLRGLSLTGVQQVSDDGLVHLKGLTDLTGLELSGTRVSDAGLAHLKRLTKLTVLGLIGTRVSDGGLKHLTGMSNLNELNLTDTQVTADGVATLQKALPKCKIIGPATK